MDLLIRSRFGIHGARTSRHDRNTFRIELEDAASTIAELDVAEDDSVASNSGYPVAVMTGLYDAEPAWCDVLIGVSEERWPSEFPLGTPNAYLFDYYPVGLQALLTRATGDQKAHLRRFVDLIRWRFDDESWGGDARVGPTEREWSLDGIEWCRLRLHPHFSASLLSSGLQLNASREQALGELMRAERYEPLGREMWHSALRAREAGDPRSAIIVAVSAVEIELKRLISFLVPEAEWLAMNLASPPIFKILRDYLVQLPGFDVSLQPPRSLLTLLNEAVEVRNELVHTGPKLGNTRKKVRDTGDVDIVLAAASDLLWLIDVYRGDRWALSHLTDATTTALGLTDASDWNPGHAG